MAEHGPWRAQWDEQTRTPRRAWGAGIPACQAEALAEPFDPGALMACARRFVDHHRALAGISSADLGAGRAHREGDRAWVSLPQLAAGLPIEGASVELRLVAGRIVVVGLATHPEARGLTPSPRLSREDAGRAALARAPGGRLAGASLSWLPLQAGDALRYALAWRVDVERGAPPLAERLWIDAGDGRILGRQDLASPFVDGMIQVMREPLFPGDALAPAPLSYADAAAGATPVLTTAGGSFFIPGAAPQSLTAPLAGPYVAVTDERIPGVPTHTFSSLSGSGLTLTWAPEDDGDRAALDAFAAFFEVRDYIEARRPQLRLLDEVLPISVNGVGDPGAGGGCNAYYGPSVGMVFLQALPGECENFARLADIVYHEYGHAVHHSLLSAGNFDGAVSEGSADYLAATITDSPVIGDGARGPGTRLREIETDRILPWDLVNQVHTDGLIWGGALWDLRTLLIARDGYEAGRAAVDALLLDVLVGGPTLWELYPEILAADDDDGDLSNGTPNLCEIDAALGPHGLGDGALGVVDFGHTPVLDQPAGADGYRITARPTVFGGPCALADLSSLTVYHRVEGGPWRPTPMAPTEEEGTWEAILPPAPPGATITYDIQLWDADRDHWASLTGGRDDLAPRFYVGDTHPLWCDDLDEDADLRWSRRYTPADTAVPDWHWDFPLGTSSDAPRPYTGRKLWGTNLALTATDGWPAGRYRPSQVSTLTSPPFDASGEAQVRLSYWRWLTVEDGGFDAATISAGGQLAWHNEASEEGLYHTLDVGWFHHSLAIWGADGQAQATVSFALDSDEGLEFGGWNLDDVCVTAPSDLPDRYRGALSEGGVAPPGGVALTGALPWAAPMSRAAVVRQIGRPPTTVGDGVVVLNLGAPEAGEAFEVIDEAPPGGQPLYYRLFAWDGVRWWPAEAPAGGETAAVLPLATPTPQTPTPPTPTEAETETAAPSPTSSPTEEPSASPSAASPTPTPGDQREAERCGCAAGAAGGSGWWGLLAVAGLRRRRRR